MKSAIEIANSAALLPITEIARSAGILEDELVQYGRNRGKVKLSSNGNSWVARMIVSCRIRIVSSSVLLTNCLQMNV